AGATVAAGKPVTFSVQASGTGPLAYQWLKDGVPIDGATGSSYSLAAAAPADAGSYSVRVTNAYGSATSQAAILAVRVAPATTSQPAGATVAAGKPVTFSVQASGTGPLAYQWLKDGVPIDGATASTYQIARATTSDAGFYTVMVSNAFGKVTSQKAKLTVRK